MFPVRDGSGALVGFVRFQPNPDRRTGAKSIAEGPRELWPPPESLEPGGDVWLWEGEPDAVAGTTATLRSVGVPGVNTWKDGWAQRFARFDRVIVCFDCDDQGRTAAEARATDLRPVVEVVVVDLDTTRDDGYDVGDLLLERGVGTRKHLELLATRAPHKLRLVPGGKSRRLDPTGDVLKALEARHLKVRSAGPNQWEAQCPNHEDRHPSMSVAEGRKGTLLHCHTGCPPEAIVAALGMEWGDVFKEESGT